MIPPGVLWPPLPPRNRILRERTLTVQTASAVGTLLAERAAAAGVERVVFDRGGYAYHGRVKALAQAAREAGLDF